MSPNEIQTEKSWSFDERINKFVEQLDKLDPGEKARLKRSAGKTLAEANNAIGLFYKLLPYNVWRGNEENYFLIATLYPLADASEDVGNFGDSLRRARSSKPDDNKGLDRRVEILLDSEADEQLAYRLRQAVRFLKSRNKPVHWHWLLHDLLRWNRHGRYVQRRWAHSYFVGGNASKLENEAEVNEQVEV